MLLETKELAEKQAKAAASMRVLTELAYGEDKRDLTSEESEEYDRYMDEYTSLDKQIKRIIKIIELTAEQKERIAEKAEENGESTDEAEAKAKKYSKAFENFIRKGVGKLSSDDRELMEAHVRAQSVGTDSEGGFLVPEEFSNDLEIALKAFGGIRQIAGVFSTGTGAPLPWPTVDSTSNQGEWLSENTEAAELDEVFGSVTFNAFTASSKSVRVSRQLLQDSFFNVPQYLAGALGERIGRLTADAWVNGTGSGQPLGVSGSAVPITSSDDVTITFDDLKDLKYDLDPAYRQNGTFVLNDQTLKAISKLKDDDGQYLLQESVRLDLPSTILGHAFVIDQAVSDIGAGNRSVLFGDFNKYKIRDVLGIDLIRQDELYSNFFQVGFVAFMRTDGKLLDAGQGPVRALRHPNT